MTFRQKKLADHKEKDRNTGEDKCGSANIQDSGGLDSFVLS